MKYTKPEVALVEARTNDVITDSNSIVLPEEEL